MVIQQDYEPSVNYCEFTAFKLPDNINLI